MSAVVLKRMTLNESDQEVNVQSRLQTVLKNVESKHYNIFLQYKLPDKTSETNSRSSLLVAHNGN